MRLVTHYNVRASIIRLGLSRLPQAESTTVLSWRESNGKKI
jgi:hypothetical protein